MTCVQLTPAHQIQERVQFRLDRPCPVQMIQCQPSFVPRGAHSLAVFGPDLFLFQERHCYRTVAWATRLLTREMSEKECLMHRSLPDKVEAMLLRLLKRLRIAAWVSAEEIVVEEQSTNPISSPCPFGVCYFADRCFYELQRIASLQSLGSNCDWHRICPGESIQPATIALFAQAFTRKKNQFLCGFERSPPSHTTYATLGTAPNTPPKYLAYMLASRRTPFMSCRP